jgi:hypothetical protein
MNFESQTTNHLLMIRPVRFGYNAQTAVNNAFQVQDANQEMVQQKATEEFDAFVSRLQEAGVDVTVVQDSADPHTPDSIFPNNWVSFHADGMVILYPMYAPNRRLERKPAILEAIAQKFIISKQVDFSGSETNDIFLEGTGSMVLDRENKISYACISPRTDAGLLLEWCKKTGYQAVSFDAVDEKGTAIYHTNVLMAVADKYVVICLDAIPSKKERDMVVETITNSGKQIVPISFDQMNHFAGNMLQVENATGEKILVMSSQAWQWLTGEQQALLSSFNKIVHSSLNTIESNGGGSARCMMAEVHLRAVGNRQ